MTWIKPTVLFRHLKKQLANGQYRLTTKEVCKAIFGVETVGESHILEIKRCWPAAEKRLRRNGICAIGVTEYYFRKFRQTGVEPTDPEAIRRCLAINWNKGYGFRLLTLKGSRNDPMAVMWLRLRMLNVQGGQSAILDRIAIEYAKGTLSKALAQKLVGLTTEPALPEHEEELDELMK